MLKRHYLPGREEKYYMDSATGVAVVGEAIEFLTSHSPFNKTRYTCFELKH